MLVREFIDAGGGIVVAGERLHGVLPGEGQEGDDWQLSLQRVGNAVGQGSYSGDDLIQEGDFLVGQVEAEVGIDVFDGKNLVVAGGDVLQHETAVRQRFADVVGH